MPLVSGVVRAYERGKGTSRVVRYGADLVESSVTSLSGRVVSSVGPERLAQIDRYAGAALDRLGQFSGMQSPSSHAAERSPSAASGEPDEAFACPHARRDWECEPGEVEMASAGAEQDYLVTRSDSEAETPAASPGGRLVASNSRSMWQSMLVEASMTAGGIGAAVSEESMKSLKYCLQWLHYATAQLEHQITVLRDFIASLSVPQDPSNALVSAGAVQTLARIKKEVVETIRKVVDVVSKYAGGALPEQAKQFVRNSILGLPLRWASTVQADQRETGARAATEVAADRVLTFAVESLDMLKSITGIFAESVDRADAWVERLRVIGIQHRHQRAAATEHDAGESSRPTRAIAPRRAATRITCDPTALSTPSSSRARVRSRDSSLASTCGSSRISGCDQSTSSVNTTNTTVTSSASATEHTFIDRASVKRRRANGDHLQRTHRPGRATDCSSTTSALDAGCMISPGGMAALRQAPLVGDGLEQPTSSSLKKLLLDQNVCEVDRPEEYDECWWNEDEQEDSHANSGTSGGGGGCESRSDSVIDG